LLLSFLFFDRLVALVENRDNCIVETVEFFPEKLKALNALRLKMIVDSGESSANDLAAACDVAVLNQSVKCRVHGTLRNCDVVLCAVCNELRHLISIHIFFTKECKEDHLDGALFEVISDSHKAKTFRF